MIGWLISTILTGLIAGWLAAKLMHMDSSSWARNLMLGLIGSFVGGLLGGLFGLAATSLAGSILLSTIGACVAVWLYGKLKK
jgi:uncharacterized membrane protein YeaQ/YmgE (transglycosylase-associated protein family)